MLVSHPSVQPCSRPLRDFQNYQPVIASSRDRHSQKIFLLNQQQHQQRRQNTRSSGSEALPHERLSHNTSTALPSQDQRHLNRTSVARGGTEQVIRYADQQMIV